MPTASPDLIDTLSRVDEVVSVAFTRDSSRERARSLAEAMRTLWPGASLYAVSLKDAAGFHRYALDAEGRLRPDGEIASGGHELLNQNITWHQRDHGHLTLAVNKGQTDAARVFLLHIAQSVAAHCQMAVLHADLASEAIRADFGELAGPLIHDVTNVLNNIQLNLMVLEQGAGDLSTINLSRIKARMDHVAAQVREAQEQRRRMLPAIASIDVNEAATEAVAVLTRDYLELLGTATISTDLQPDLPSVRGARTDVVRCLLLILKNAARAARPNGHAPKLSTTVHDGRPVVRIEAPGVRVTGESGAKLYDTLAATLSTVSALELAAARSIARRFDGRPAADCDHQDGLVFQLTIGPNGP